MDQFRSPRDRLAQPLADALDGLGLDPQHFARKGQALGLGIRGQRPIRDHRHRGPPCPVGNILPPALPTGGRTIAHPRKVVNAGNLDSVIINPLNYLLLLIGWTGPEVWRIGPGWAFSENAISLPIYEQREKEFILVITKRRIPPVTQHQPAIFQKIGAFFLVVFLCDFI